MEIKLSEQILFKNETFIDQAFIVDTLSDRWDKTIFTNCKFKFTATGTLNFTGCTFENCIFEGIDDANSYSVDRGELRFNGCRSVKNIQLKSQFRTLHSVSTLFFSFQDNSITIDYVMSGCEISDSTIIGSCRRLQLTNVIFQSSKTNNSLPKKISSFFKRAKTSNPLFNKAISIHATCNKVVFDNVDVHPFYLSAKCPDKNTIDLTSATLIDDWSKLRKRYAGLSLFIVFFLTLLFLLPLFTHSFFLLTLSKIDVTSLKIQRLPLWDVLLFGGKQGIAAFFYAILTIVLLLYNICRVWMTVSIAKLREEERFLKDANFQIVSIHPNRYEAHIKVDKVISVVLWISVGYSILKLIDALMIVVPSLNS